jgi:hypothetical protein
MEVREVDKDEDPYNKDYNGDGRRWPGLPNFKVMRDVQCPEGNVSTFLVRYKGY